MFRLGTLGTVGQTLQIDGKDFGEFTSLRYGNTVDAAFVEQKVSSLLPPWWILQKKLTNGETIDYWSDASVTPEGSTIRKYGNTTGLTTGKIVSNSASGIGEDGYDFYVLTETTMRAEPGDSGGPCIATVNGKNVLVGIVKAKNNNTGHTYYCKINYIAKELSVTPTMPEL